MKIFASFIALCALSLTLMAAPLPEVTVYKSAYCGCCGNWTKHMESNGFKVKTIVTEDMDTVKKKFNIPGNLQSCHTAVIGDYIIEGHVPADLIKKLLKDAPKVKGLTVPGMIVGTPGMEQGIMKQPYEVLTFQENGKVSTYAKR